MNLITAEYRSQNAKLHEDPAYGLMGSKWYRKIYAICEEVGSLDVLDYGCGKRALQKGLGFAIKNYDPAIPEFSALPEPADIVVCLDVMEHIEPECLDSVLDHIQSLTKKCAVFSVATDPAKKNLPDGRNAHLIQQPMEWWLPKFWSRFRICLLNELVEGEIPVGFSLIVKPR